MALRDTDRARSLRIAAGMAAVLSCLSAATATAADKAEDPHAAVRLYWEKALTKCDGFYLRTEAWSDPDGKLPDPQYKAFEYQKLGFKLAGKRVTAEDRQDGVDWRGTATVDWKVWRFRDPKHPWSDWYNSGALSQEVEVIRKHGTVLFKPDEATSFIPLSDVTQSQACPPAE
jgi:hypothetical protein